MTTPPTTIRRWHRWWFIPIEVGGLLAILGWLWVTQWSPMARLKASGAPTTLAELVPETIPDEENVAAGMRDLEAVLSALPNKTVDFIRSLEGVPEGNAAIEARGLLEQHAELLQRVRETASRSAYVSVARIDQLDVPAVVAKPAAIAAKEAARLLRLEIRVHLAEGRGREAAESALVSLRLGGAVGHEPLLVNRMIAIAVQSIALEDAELVVRTSEPDTDTRRRLVIALRELEDRSTLVDTLESDRALWLDGLAGWPLPVRLFWVGGVLETYEQAIEAASTLAPGEFPDAGKRIAQGGDALLGPLIEGPFQSEARVAARAGALRKLLEQNEGSE